MQKNEIISDRYRLVKRLGEPNMGDVWLVEDLNDHKELVLKAFNRGAFRDDLVENGRERFEREIKIIRESSHPCIPAYHDEGHVKNENFYVMEYVGKNLLALQQECAPMAEKSSVSVVAQLCSALDYLHSRRFTHRDIKPDNVLVNERGIVKLCDYGIGVDRRTNERRVTRTEDDFGTRAYKAPEQWVSAKGAGPPADIYALGCLFYWTLTGEEPYAGETDLAQAHKSGAIPRAREKRKSLTPDVDELIAQMMAKKPEDRPVPAKEVYTRLRPHLPSTEYEPLGLAPRPDPVWPYQRGYAPPEPSGIRAV